MTTANTVIPAFKMAIKHRCPSASKEFIELLDKYNIVRSNSRKGNCWDNAVAESFFKTQKCELVYQIGVKTVEQTRNTVFEYIECWYNKKRRHKALNNLNID